MDNNIRSDRSRMQTRQKCQLERLYSYHILEGGRTKIGGKYDAAFGTLIHELLTRALLAGPNTSPTISTTDLDRLDKAIEESFEEHLWEHLKREQTHLLLMLVLGWSKFRRDPILTDFEVVESEQEHTVVFQATKYLPENVGMYLRNLEMPLRRDAVLRNRVTGNLSILDWKTVSRQSDDWEVGLHNSMQTNVYLAGSEELDPNNYWVGVQYEGLVKGKRENDKAKSSPFIGLPIQYGSFLYGWKKNGGVSNEYKSGAKRVFLPDECGGTAENVFNYLCTIHDMRTFFPSCIAWKPNNCAKIVAQQILAENNYATLLEAYMNTPQPEQWRFEGLFEQSLDGCYKYGSKHPCQFVGVCHGGHSLTDDTVFENRTDHHSDPSK